MKTIAIMQPYLFPYIGYFQLLNATDIFVVYDNIQFTKKGWIHRNRILVNGKASYVTLPLKKDSDLLSIKNRCLSVSFDKEKHKLLRRIKETYRKAPFCNAVYPLIERCFNFTDFNLFNFVYNSICESAAFLGVTKCIM